VGHEYELPNPPPASFGSDGPELTFPCGFLWGVSTSGYQVEGESPPSQWAEWELAGKIRSGDRSEDACDWWKNAERDFDLAQQLRINALRLSVEWSRLQPQPHDWDYRALDRYREMLQGLHDRGIRPIVCLHHFAHPSWFENRGGFLNSAAASDYGLFVEKVVNGLADLCRDWVTFNEPNVYAALGYVLGEFPPGAKGRIIAALRVVRSMLEGHVRAYRKIHEIQPDAQVGWAQHYAVFHPAGGAIDRLVARNLDLLFNQSFLRTIEDGTLGFPFNLLDGKMPEARGACDFVGLNVYSRFNVAFSGRRPAQMFADIYVPPGVPQGDRCLDRPYGEAYPRAIRVAVERVAPLGKPIYILENGVPDASDRLRPWLIVNAVREMHDLIARGHEIRGYFHWSLTDNFEWSEGWRLRFGLISLDPVTQERKLRKSAEIYRSIAQANGIPACAAEQLRGEQPPRR
jgi:beta-glucosidase